MKRDPRCRACVASSSSALRARRRWLREAGAAARPVRPVTLAQVATGTAGDIAVFAGEVKPRYESDLGFRIGGKIDRAQRRRRRARDASGQVLARLDPADVGLQADAQSAAVAAAETEYKFAQAEYDRYANLLKQKFISASALDAEAQRARHQPRQVRAGEARSSRSRATRRATRRSSPTRTASSPRSTPRRGRSWRPASR